MHTQAFFLSFGLMAALQGVSSVPMPAGPAQGGRNSQISRILRGTGLRGMNAAQLNTLISNLSAEGLTLGCDAGAGAGAGADAGEGAAGGKGAGEEAAAGEGEGEGNEVELAGQFDVPVAVEGGEIKQDILYTATTAGAFEYEYQAAAADEITVSENKTPAAPPAGFEAIESSSFKVSLTQSKGVGLTLSKIDYIFDTASTALEGKDITKAQVGKLCADTNEFIISETLGELEFELEENEVTLNLNKNVTAEGEWGIFLPLA